jgi:Glycosyltransferase family 87
MGRAMNAPGQMPLPTGKRGSAAGFRRLAALSMVTLAAVMLVWTGCRTLPWDRMFPDFICYWTAGKLLAEGESPYDADLQAQVQRENGWDRSHQGFDVYDFLPFYYPPWFGFLFVPLLPLGFEGARLAWFFINVELLLMAGCLLREQSAGVPGWLPWILVPGFMFSVMAVALGQTTVVVLFLLALAWHLLDHRHDVLAGLVLAWLTIKPQLTTVLLVAVGVRLIRQRRWAGIATVFIMTAVLCLASSLVIPDWLPRFLAAPRQTPSPTEYFPWIGNTWYLLLRSLGAKGCALPAAYVAVAVPMVALVLRGACRPAVPLGHVVAWALVAAFFVAPYARHYDFPVLLVPFLVLVRNCTKYRTVFILALAVLLLPYLQFQWLAAYKSRQDPDGRFMLECSYFWIPLLLALSWLCRDGWHALTRRQVGRPEACLSYSEADRWQLVSSRRRNQ